MGRYHWDQRKLKWLGELLIQEWIRDMVNAECLRNASVALACLPDNHFANLVDCMGSQSERQLGRPHPQEHRDLFGRMGMLPSFLRDFHARQCVGCNWNSRILAFECMVSINFCATIMGGSVRLELVHDWWIWLWILVWSKTKAWC